TVPLPFAGRTEIIGEDSTVTQTGLDPLRETWRRHEATSPCSAACNYHCCSSSCASARGHRHRHSAPGSPGPRGDPREPRLLCSERFRHPLLLRPPVLGLCQGWLVCGAQLERSMGSRRARVRPHAGSPSPCPLLCGAPSELEGVAS